MTARELSELRNRDARAALARGGEVLPEADRRKTASLRRAVGPVERSPILGGETRLDGSPLTAADLTADERLIFDRLWSEGLVASTPVDIVDHLVLIARNNARAKRCGGGAR